MIITILDWFAAGRAERKLEYKKKYHEANSGYNNGYVPSFPLFQHRKGYVAQWRQDLYQRREDWKSDKGGLRTRCYIPQVSRRISKVQENKVICIKTRYQKYLEKQK